MLTKVFEDVAREPTAECKYDIQCTELSDEENWISEDHRMR